MKQNVAITSARYRGPGSHRYKLTRQEPHRVEAFCHTLRERVADLQQIFFDILNCIRVGESGPEAGVALECATQTAHVHAARLLLYRIGKAQGVAESEMRDLAPGVYELGEFDWWRQIRRLELSGAALKSASSLEEDLDAATKKLLGFLCACDLSGMDLDIWRDVYQHFLPPEERQQSGSFFTPQELVDLTLDLAGYRPGVEHLCEKLVLDPAMGSGAFVVGALQRLLEHLNDKSHACHRRLHDSGVSEWEWARGMLQIIVTNIRAIDSHPFAAFLTFTNFLVAVLPIYLRARSHGRSFELNAAIFADDSLLPMRESAAQGEFGRSTDSSARAVHHVRERYRQVAAQKFDLIVGNPPWGGILKGRLAPIFDKQYKEQLAAEYRDTFTGKLDIYGLFYDRALQWLKPGGMVAFITQGSFIDKDWAAPHTEYNRREPIHIMGLRRKLAEQASLSYLIDLNPFGKLFFGAMNIPCIGVFEKRPAREGDQAIVLLSSKKSWPKEISATERRSQVVSRIRRCIELVENSGEPLNDDFVTAFRFPLARLRDFGGERWLLAAKEFKIRTRPEWPRLAQLLEPSQGVTVGGKGCLSTFLMTEARASELGLEKALLHSIVKGHETTPWRLERGDQVILYPYARDENGRWQPAFACKKPPVLDALDFAHPGDKFEQDWLRRFGLNTIGIRQLFEHRRDALELIKHPKAAEYLLKWYEQLSTRTFKKRNVREFGRAWYEFIWPRDPEVIFGRPKIISPRLTPQVRFALDQEGTGIQDSCVCLSVSAKTRPAFDEFRGRLSGLLEHEVEAPTALRYLLAFLNSSYAQELLTTGHRPRPGDVFQVSDQLFQELSIPVSHTRRELQRLLDAVDACMAARAPDALEAAESQLNCFVSSLYAAG